MSDFNELDERLTDNLIKAIYGFHCMATNKVYSDQKAYDEFHGKWDFSEELRYPFMRNIVHSLKGAIYENMEFKALNKQAEDK
jgi:hypothetical protein